MRSTKATMFNILTIIATLSITAGMSGNNAEARSIAQNKKELLGNISGITRVENETKDGADFIESTLKAAQALNAYSFHYKMTCFKTAKPIIEEGNFFFKKPKLMRLVQTAGPKSGSIAVLCADGKVRAHMGGALKLFAATLSPDSDMLRSANGWPMVKSDFASLAEAVQGFVKDGMTSKVSTQPIINEDNLKVFVVEVYKKSGEIYKRYNIDAQSLLPVEWWDFQDGKLFAHSTWTNLKTNEQFSDQLFTLKGH